jgi:hypothetical protein
MVQELQLVKRFPSPYGEEYYGSFLHRDLDGMIEGFHPLTGKSITEDFSIGGSASMGFSRRIYAPPQLWKKLQV